jgi:hypothetical protein
MEGAIVLKIKKAYQQKMLKWKEDSSFKGKQLVQRASTSLSTYFASYIVATTPRLLLWKNRCNEGLLKDKKINMQVRCQVKSIKYPIRSILDENKEEIFRSNAKFEALLVICKEVI